MTAGLVSETGQADQSRELVARFQAGDVDAFGEIYRLHRGVVFAYLYAKCHDRELAEDLTQTAFVRAWGGLARWQWQGKSVLAFLKTIGANLLHDHHKSAYERMTSCNPAAIEYAMATVADDGPDGRPDEQAINRALTGDLTGALAQLTPKQQQCLRMRYLEGRSQKETATALGLTKDGVGVLTWRATRALRRLLDREAVTAGA